MVQKCLIVLVIKIIKNWRNLIMGLHIIAGRSWLINHFEGCEILRLTGKNKVKIFFTDVFPCVIIIIQVSDQFSIKEMKKKF